ncbi:MAG: SGNH/GDSL hydrolase family protein [Planctomycetota bacterium]
MTPARKQTLKRLGLLFGSFGLALLLAEGILRVAGYRYIPIHIEFKGHVHDWRFYHLFEDKDFEYDADLFWRPKRGHSVFNAQGFLGRELRLEKGAKEIRIFTLGDSNTVGWKMKGGASWPEVLESLLAKRREGVTVVNAGVWGYSSLQGRKLFERILPYRPDLVLVSFGANDAHKVAVSDAEFHSLSTFKSPLAKLRLGQLVIAAWDRCVAGRSRPADADLVPRVSVREYKANLTEIIRLSKQNGVTCILLTRPFTGESVNPLWWKNFAPAYVEATWEAGREQGVQVIDLHGLFKAREDLFIDESHFTEEGHHHAGKIIEEAMPPAFR